MVGNFVRVIIPDSNYTDAVGEVIAIPYPGAYRVQMSDGTVQVWMHDEVEVPSGWRQDSE